MNLAKNEIFTRIFSGFANLAGKISCQSRKLELSSRQQLRGDHPVAKNKGSLLILTLLASIAIYTAPAKAAAEMLVWVESRNAALAQALAEGKMVLLLAGRTECGNCNGVRYVASEKTLPEMNIRGLIDSRYVPWYTNMDDSNEHSWYSTGYGRGYVLPFLALIDPADPKAFMIRWNGYNEKKYFDYLTKYQNGNPDSKP